MKSLPSTVVCNGNPVIPANSLLILYFPQFLRVSTSTLSFEVLLLLMHGVQESVRVKNPGTGQFYLLFDFQLISIIKYNLWPAY